MPQFCCFAPPVPSHCFWKGQFTMLILSLSDHCMLGECEADNCLVNSLVFKSRGPSLRIRVPVNTFWDLHPGATWFRVLEMGLEHKTGATKEGDSWEVCRNDECIFHKGEMRTFSGKMACCGLLHQWLRYACSSSIPSAWIPAGPLSQTRGECHYASSMPLSSEGLTVLCS